jgi:hypothetical protein
MCVCIFTIDYTDFNKLINGSFVIDAAQYQLELNKIKNKLLMNTMELRVLTHVGNPAFSHFHVNSAIQVLRSNSEGAISTIVVINQQAELEEPGVNINGRKNSSIYKCT